MEHSAGDLQLKFYKLTSVYLVIPLAALQKIHGGFYLKSASEIFRRTFKYLISEFNILDLFFSFCEQLLDIINGDLCSFE